jgi:hypothetical protein
VEGLALESNAVFGFVSVNASNSNDIFLTNFESSGVEDVDALGTEESLNHSEVILGHVSREVARDSTLVWVPQLCVGLVNVEDFFLNLRIEFIEHLSVEAVLVEIARIRQENLVEGRSGQVWDEFVVTEVVVVTEVAIETCNKGDELLVLLSCDSLGESSLLGLEEIFLLEIGLEDEEEWGSLVAELMENHLGACPRSPRHEVRIILLFVCEKLPWLLVSK